MLEQENKGLEEKLQMVQKMMDLEKQKRGKMDEMSASHKQGTIWRSATTNQPLQGYSKAVLDSMKNSKPPTGAATAANGKNPFQTGISPAVAKEGDHASKNL